MRIWPVKRPGDRRIVSASPPLAGVDPESTPAASLSLAGAGNPPGRRRRLRPLGAALPVPDRLVALETWIRDMRAAVDELAEAHERLDSEASADAGHAFWRALTAVYERAESNIRRRRQA